MPPLVTIGSAAKKQNKQAPATNLGRLYLELYQYFGFRSTIIVHIPSTATYLNTKINIPIIPKIPLTIILRTKIFLAQSLLYSKTDIKPPNRQIL